MSFFNDALQKAKKAADTVGKSASNAADIAKLKFSEGEAKSEIKTSYETLGQLVYESQIDGTDASAQVEDIVANITALKQKIADIQAQLLKISNKTTCSNCGEINPLTASFCAKCGAKIEAPAEEEPVEACETCGEAECTCDCAEAVPAEEKAE